MPRPMPQIQKLRAPGTRTSSRQTRQRQLESLAAEFALLAQRRARTGQQIEALQRQLQAATQGFTRLEHRLAWLVRQMDALDPALRPYHAEDPEPDPPPPPAALRQAPRPRPKPQTADTPLPAPQVGRWAALQGAASPRPHPAK